MDPVHRTQAEPGYVLCSDCDGVGSCVVCGGLGSVEREDDRSARKPCPLCIGRRACRICGGTGQVPSRAPAAASAFLEARSSSECQLYLELHPHDCGEYGFSARARVERGERGLVAVYEAPCPRCNQNRRVEFRLVDELPPPAPAYGGSQPSKILDAGEFLYAADERLKDVPASPAGLERTRVLYARERLAEAIAALEEILKWIPPGQDHVPGETITSRRGGKLYRREPGRFARVRVEAALSTYRAGLQHYNLELAGG